MGSAGRSREDARGLGHSHCRRRSSSAPPRPTGIERNVVVSQWDWGFPESFVHDLISTDKRNPTLYAYGKVYGVDRTGGGRLLILDPMKNTVSWLQVEPQGQEPWLLPDKGLLPRRGRRTRRILGKTAEWMASPHNPCSMKTAACG